MQRGRTSRVRCDRFDLLSGVGHPPEPDYEEEDDQQDRSQEGQLDGRHAPLVADGHLCLHGDCTNRSTGPDADSETCRSSHGTTEITVPETVTDAVSGVRFTVTDLPWSVRSPSDAK